MVHLVGERKALSSAILAFYAFLFLIVSLAVPPEYRAVYAALGLVYGTGFFSLVAGYFWARWYALGLGLSGVMSAAASIFQLGPEPVILFYGATHAAVALMLWGSAMAQAFDGRKEWRERFHLDEAGTERLGKSIIRVGFSLPVVVVYALAPRDDATVALIAAIGAALAAAGLLGLVRLRTWAVFALTGAAGAILTSLALSTDTVAPIGCTNYGVHLVFAGAVGTLALGFAVAPLAAPLWRHLRGRAE